MEQTQNGLVFGYVRVSTVEQDESRQLEGVPVQKKFIDRSSGKDIRRPQLEILMTCASKGDQIIVHSMDRLARNLVDLRKIITEMTTRGVVIRFVKESMTFTGEDSPMSTFMLNIMGSFAEFERALIRERQREGISLAKARGVYTGRKPSLSPEQIIELRSLVEQGIPKSKVARRFKITRPTVYEYLKINI